MTQRRRHPDSDAPNEVARTGRVRLSRALLSLTLLAVGACDGQIGDPPASGPGPDGRRPGDPVELRIEPRVWRLSPAHFQSELHRLFGEDVPTVTLPPGAPENGLTDIAETSRVDLGNASTFVEGARTVGVWVSANPSATRCADFGTAACADTLLDWLPESAFRRPITSDERRELRTLYDALAQEYDHAYATSGVIRAILLSPDFLYRTELGGASEPRAEVELTDHEIATLLAFALTDRAPDAELLAAAEAGRLGRADEREAHARRLMDDSSEVWRRFFWEWLRMATLQSQGNEVGLEPELVAQMEAELRAFVGDVIVEERGTLRDLMSATHTFASPELAALYGASHPGDGVARVELAPERGGLLTRGAWLVAHGKRGRDNVVRRGMGVFVDAMCNDIQVPADLDVEAELDRLVGPDATVREVTEARGNAGVCGNCHRFADPVGLVFENFASDGAWQTSYADGLPVEPQITLEGLGSFDDASSFSAALAEDLRFQHCLVRRFAHFALGVDLGSPAAVAWTNEAHTSFVESGTSFEEMVVALVRHPAFIERKAD